MNKLIVKSAYFFKMNILFSILIVLLNYGAAGYGKISLATKENVSAPVLLLSTPNIFIEDIPVNSEFVIDVPITNNGHDTLWINHLKGSCACLIFGVKQLEVPPESTRYMSMTYIASSKVGPSGPYLVNFKTNDPYRPQQSIRLEFELIEEKDRKKLTTIRLPEKPVSYLLGESNVDIGNIDSHMKVKKMWVFRNLGNAPLAIDNVGLSCGNCLKLMSKMPIEIGPGEYDSIEIEFDPKGISGPFSHKAVVFSNDLALPRYELEITGKSKKSFYVFPQNGLFPCRGNGRFLLVLEDPSLNIDDFKIDSEVLKVEKISPKFWVGRERRYLVEGAVPNGIDLSNVEVDICVQKNDSTNEVSCYNIGAKKQISDTDVQDISSDITTLEHHKIGKYYFGSDGKQISLAEGTFLVAFLSVDCEHCTEIVSELNNLAEHPDCPQIVGLVLDEAGTFQSFKDLLKPRFPVELITVNEFFKYIDTAPPRFILAIDGHPIQYWDKELPSDIISQITRGN